MRKVFVVNKSGHDLSEAEREGELVYLSEGAINRFNVNNMYRQFSEVMVGSDKEDLIVPCGLSIMNLVACSILSYKHGKLNLLLFKQERGRRGRYVLRTIVFDGGKNGTSPDS